MLPKVIVRYPHESHILDTIYLSVGNPGPKGRVWVPAYRDTVNGERVVWIRVPKKPVTSVWIMDTNGPRQAPESDIVKKG